jgi:conjugative relaxase-like TrwC/TraI family protein
MLSNIKKIGSAKQASSYYKKADYYTKGEDSVDISSSWFGKAAEQLELDGFVDHKAFEAIMAGVLPDGTVLDHSNRVIGWDLTFSAPKSASVLALVGGDNRLLDAHFESVKAALKFAEEEFAVTRKTENGNTFIEKTGNYIAALFTHTTSRALDPALHTHSVLMNVTLNSEGEWRAIESNPLFDNRMLLGLAYQNEFAQRAKELGYEPVRNDRTGQFELAEVPGDVIDEFSQRRNLIIATAKEQGVSLDDAKSMEQIALRTRDAKKNIPTNEIVTDWDKRLSVLDFDIQKTIDNAKKGAVLSIPENDTHDPINIIKLAIENLSFKDSVFSRQDLIKETFRFDRFAVVVGDLADHIDTLVQSGALLESRKDEIGQKRQIAYTTPANIDREREILGLVKSGLDQSQAMGTKDQVADFIARYNADSDKPLNQEQQAALTGLVTNTDRFQGLQGLPGVGKSTLMHAFNVFSNEQGYKLIGIAPTGTAAQELYAKANMQTRTIDSLLEIEKHRDDKAAHEPNTMYVTDESGMVSDRHTVTLLRLFTMSDSRMVGSGDINQISAIEAGAPFEQQQKSYLAFEVMRNIQRQKDPVLKAAVFEAIDNTISSAFETLKKSSNPDTGIVNIEDTQHRHDAAISHYDRLLSVNISNGESLSSIVNEKVKIITPLNRTKDALNESVREKLLARGLLDNTSSQSMLTLLPKGLSPVEQQQTIGFIPYHDDGTNAGGDVIRFHDDVQVLGIKQGEYYQVKAIKEQNLTLFNQDRGHTTDINMEAHKEDNLLSIFSVSRKDVAIGEQLRWKDTYQSTDIRNGQSVQVIGFDKKDNTYEVKVDDGRTLTLANDYSGGHADYNYAVTTNSIQGGTIDKTILVYGQYSKKMQTRNNLIVGLSRGQNGTFLYAENYEKLASNADQRASNKSSGLEHVGQSGAFNKIESPEFKKDVFEAKEGVIQSIEHLSAQFSAFTTHEIMRHAMRFSGQQTLSVKHAINGLVEEKALLAVQTNEQHLTYYTTPEMVKQEKELRSYLKFTAQPIALTQKHFEAATDPLALSDGAAQALKTIFTSPHALSIVNAKVNTGSSLFTHALMDLAKIQDMTFVLVSPTNQQQHSERLGRDVMSIPQYVKSNTKHDLIVVLDGHNASAKAFNRLLDKSTNDMSKVVVQGVTGISQAFAHKDALSNLAKNANKTQLFDLITDGMGKVDLLLSQTEGQISNAFKKQLERETTVIQGESQRHEKIVADYLKNPDSNNIISTSKEGAKQISDKIRGTLKQSGKLMDEMKVKTLSPVFLTEQQKQVSSEYKIGQIIIFNRKGEKNGFSRQETYVVEKIDPQSNTIHIRSSSGSHIVNPHELKTNTFSVAASVNTVIGKGERIRFDTGIFEFKIPQNSAGKVVDTHHNEQKLTVELDSGRKVQLDLSMRAHQFISHGYTQSMNKSASMPMNRHALIELDGRFKSAANIQNFLKSLTNAKQSVSLYSDKRSTVSNYLSPSKDHERGIDALLHRETQHSTVQAKAMAPTFEQSQTHQNQQTQHEHQNEHIKQRER